jgi:3-deoxy-D-manno-octulosonate 8-phosphate phosphatase (KDO 8-P phosphatase)
MKKVIRLFVTDVDGTLTDGGMYYTNSGDEFKKFNAQDGMGIYLLREKGIKTAIITKENTQIVERRAKKLKVDFLEQSVDDKLEMIRILCIKENISIEECAYIGDDVNDMEALAYAGLSACPANAVTAVKEMKGIMILNSSGGNGAVREFIEYILKECSHD